MKAKILLVEDNADCSEILSIYLRHIGHEPVEARTGEEAIAQALNDAPDIILMDLSLPGISGIEAATVIKQNPRTSKIPIIAVSAQPPRLWEEKAQQAGMSLFITKPASLEGIIKAIEKVLSDREMVNGSLCDNKVSHNSSIASTL